MSSRSAMSPTLAVSPLSPERACASLTSLMRIPLLSFAVRKLLTNRPQVKGRDDERVVDGALADEARHGLERHEPHGRLLCASGDGLVPELDAARDVGVQPVVLNGGVRARAADEDQLASAVARLFQ